VAAAFKRIRNILKQAQDKESAKFAAGRIESSLLELGPETDLYNAFLAQRNEFKTRGSYGAKLEAVAKMRPEIDLFFDKVLVNAPDPAVRHNRLTLLHSMLSEFSTIADFSEIVTSSQSAN
jgi:glycyl-tRNA synthetase beta chain